MECVRVCEDDALRPLPEAFGVMFDFVELSSRAATRACHGVILALGEVARPRNEPPEGASAYFNRNVRIGTWKGAPLVILERDPAGWKPSGLLGDPP